MRFVLPSAALALVLALAVPAGAAEPAPSGRAAVRGEVARPGDYALSPGETLSSLIERAGGLTDNAFTPGAILRRATAKVRQGEELEAIVREIESRLASAPGGGDENGKEAFLVVLRSLSPSGRIPVRLSHPRLLRGSPADIPLEDGDALLVPGPPATVTIVGAVASPGPHPHAPGASHRRHIRSAGGTTEGADLSRAWVLRADGSAATLAARLLSWNPARARWELIGFQGGVDRRIGPGDTIVVPKSRASVPWLGGAGEIDDLLMRAAVLTGEVVTP